MTGLCTLDLSKELSGVNIEDNIEDQVIATKQEDQVPNTKSGAQKRKKKKAKKQNGRGDEGKFLLIIFHVLLRFNNGHTSLRCCC